MISFRSGTAGLMVYSTLLAGTPLALQANSSIVPRSEFRDHLRKAAENRQQNLDAINRVLSTETARAELAKVRIDGAEARKAIAQLSDDELSRLADRARNAEADVTAGGPIVTILAIIGAIVVIIVVARAVA